MTRAATQKLSLRYTKKGTALIAVPSVGIYNPCSESFEGAWGNFFKSSPKKRKNKKTQKKKGEI